MSKRSSRRKRRDQQRKQDARLTGAVLAQEGYQAFQQADYDTALKLWERADQKKDAPNTLSAALAEAHFRRAMSQPAVAVADLEQAVKQQPNDQLYRYHLALAYHRAGALDKAEPLYRRLLDESPPFNRAAEPLAQLLIEQKKAVLSDPVWSQLTAEQQQQLAAAEALLKNKAKSTLERLAETSLHPLWQGLVAMALDDKATAMQQLKPLADPNSAVPQPARNVARYYVGLIAAEAGQTEAALAHWQAAQAHKLDSPSLRRNLSAVAYEQAIQARQAGNPHRAVELLDQVRATGPTNGTLRDFYHQLKLDLGYAAAQKGDWAQALSNWRQAEQEGDNSRRLLFNLALAYQHQEKFWQAAEHWRALLRRRPRKADHPDALTDQQVARIWQNVAENYSKAGEFEEAITTYKNALKWAPDNIDLRLKLVDAYQSEGRWQAAENELNRILEKEPDNVAALTLLAESYSDDYFVGNSRKIWQRILELEPQNPVARQQLARTYEREGMPWLTWQRNYEKAIEIFKEGLKQVPDSERLRVVIGGAYADWGKFDQARDYLEQARALKPTDLQTLYTIFTIWLDNESLPDMEKTLEQLQALAQTAPAGLFLDLFERCAEADQEKLAGKILAFIADRYAADVEAMVAVAAKYIDLDQEQKALSLLRQVIKEHPDHVGVNIQLGLAYFYLDQTRLAKRHWDKATALARQANDQITLHQIKLMTDELLHGKRPPQSPAEMLRNLPPQVLEQMLKDAPPEVAEMLRNMPPDMLDLLDNFGGFDDDDDELYDFDDFFR